MEATMRAAEPSSVMQIEPRLLQRFLDRIANTFDLEPWTLGPDKHRRELSDLFARLGSLDHYQLLDVSPTVGELDVLAAYHRLARLVHPRHAERLGMVGHDAPLRVLFERATEAYLTLSDPTRRMAYNNLIDAGPKIEVDAEKRALEKRAHARRLYSRATTAIAEMDYSVAADLLREAARIDPTAEHLALLGKVLSRNPHWCSDAVANLERACQMEPANAGYHLACGQIHEKMGKNDLARQHYKATLANSPGNPEAEAGLLRVGHK